MLVKGGSQLEALGTVRALAVDKTGTLTIGRPDVTDVVVLDGHTDKPRVRNITSVPDQGARIVVHQRAARG